jgi:hypothetical protein
VLRRIRRVPDEWLTRLGTLDFGRNVLAAMESDGSLLPEKPAAHAFIARIRALAGIPSRRFMLADHLDSQRILVETMRSNPSCMSGADTLDARLREQWPRRPEETDGYTSASRLVEAVALPLLQADLTRETLLARQAAATGTLADATHDGSCPGWAWQVDCSVPGWVEIRFAGKLPWSDQNPPFKSRPLSHREPIQARD